MFATLAGTQFLGAFATFDAMALFLLAFAAWLGVRAADYPFRISAAIAATKQSMSSFVFVSVTQTSRWFLSSG